MLNGTTFFTRDNIWADILTQLGGVRDTKRHTADFTFTPPTHRISAMDLKAEILKQVDAGKGRIMIKIFGKEIPPISPAQEKIILLLYKHGGMGIGQLNAALGYSANTKTHTCDTAIYQLRKTFGADFIKQSDGIYQLGKL